MNSYKYSDENISENEFMIALPSIIIGVSILSLPSEVAKVTQFSDGWVSILLGGIIFTLFAVLATKLATLFPEESFFSYTSFLVTKPVAIILVFLNILVGLFISAYSVRSVAFISQQYLFNDTPMEVIALLFLLTIVYAVSGSRAGVFRLNVLFLPIILFVFLFVGLFNIQWFDPPNMLPAFQSDVKDYLNGIIKSFDTFIGFGIVLFYVVIIKNPTNLTKKVVIGMSISTVFFIMIFLLSIIVFGNAVTENLNYPTIELAKRVDVPGGIVERIDAIVFTIWIMAIFNTVAIALDVSVLLITSIFKKVKKRIITFIFSPIIYYVAMFPQQIHEVKKMGSIASQIIAYLTCATVLVLFIIAKIRGVKNRE